MAGTLASLFVELGLKDKNLKNGVEGARRDFKKLGSDFKNVGMGMSKAFTLPALAAGGALLKIGSDHDSMVDTIRIGTGAVGKDLEALDKTALNVFSSIPTTMDKVGTAISELNRLTGATGLTLDDLAKTQLELARITETDLTTNIQSTSQAFKQWGVNVNDQSAALDVLFRTTQATGVPVATLADQLSQYGPILRQMGFGIDESTALLGTLGKAGLNAGTVITGMRTAFAKFADEGLTDTNKALMDVFTQIKNAPNDLAAGRIAIDTFGSRAGPGLSEAIRTGKLGYQDLLDTVLNGKDTILDAAASTNDWRENLQILTNRIQVKLLPVADKLFAFLNDRGIPALEKLERKVETLAKWFGGLPKPLKIAAAAFAGLLVAIGPILVIAGTIIGAIAPAIPVITALLGLISLPVLAVIAVIVLLAVAWKKNWFDIRGKTKAVIGAIWGIISPFVKKFMKATETIRYGIGRIVKAFKVGGIKGALKELFGEGGQAILKGLGRILGIIPRMIGSLIGSIRTGFGPLDAIFKNIGKIFTYLGLLIQHVLSGEFGKAFDDAKKLLFAFLNQYRLIGELLLGIFKAIPWTAIGSFLWSGFKDAVSFLITTGGPWLLDKSSTLLGKLLKGFGEKWDSDIRPWIKSLPGKIVSLLASGATVLQNAGRSLLGYVWTGIASLSSWLWNQLWSLAQSLASPIMSAYNALWSAGHYIMTGVYDGLKWVWDNVIVGFLKSVSGAIPFLKGPLEKDKVMLKPAGIAIMRGLTDGMESGLPNLYKTLGKVNSTIAGTGGTGQWRLAGMAGGAGGAGSGVVFGAGSIVVTAAPGQSEERIAEMTAARIVRKIQIARAGAVR